MGAEERKDTEDLKYLGVFGAWGQGRLVGTAGCTQWYTPPGMGEVGGWHGIKRGKNILG